MTDGRDVLARIMARKREETAALPPPDASALAQAPPPRDFAAALRDAEGRGGFPVVAEIKRKSPSAGVLRAEGFCPATIARRYAECGAACLSVLTDADFFGGENAHLRQARQAGGVPVLRKDFIADARQIAEARTLGADAILLILAALPDDSQLLEFAALADEWGMAALAEVHDEAEMERALRIPKALIGINNRNLRDFSVSLETTRRLAPRAKDAGRFVVSESGINSPEDVAQLCEWGADAFLVGGALMRSPDPGAALRELFQ